ncbi:MAG: hypothetical protein AABZ11_09790 [Nitrospinota bacterium]
MKRYLGIIFVLTFAGVFLSYSLAASVDVDQLLKGLGELGKKFEEEKKEKEFKSEQERKQKELYNKLNEILRKLPASARIVIPEFKLQIIGFETPLSDPKAEKNRLVMIEGLGTEWEKTRREWETIAESLGLKIVDREAFKEVEKEILLSQTGEVDPNSSAKFGKAVGATHMVLFNVIYDGIKTGDTKVAISVRVVDVETMLRVGSATVTIDTLSPTQKSKQPQNLFNETFYVKPGTYQSYGWNFNSAGTLNINLNANSDVLLYVVDKANLEAFNAGREFRIFSEKIRITSTNFSVSLSKGEYYIVVSNRHSLLTTAGVSLSVSFTPQ